MISRRHLIAAAPATAAAAAIDGMGAEAAQPVQPAPDWQALHADLIASYEAAKDAEGLFSEAHARIKHKLPETWAATPVIDAKAGRWYWPDDVSQVISTGIAERYFDEIATGAPALARKWGWPPGRLEQFLSEGERWRASVVAELCEKGEQWIAVWKAELHDVGEAAAAARERSDEIEERVLEAAPVSLEVVCSHLTVARRYMHPEHCPFAAQIVDDMLRSLAPVTGLQSGSAATGGET